MTVAFTHNARTALPYEVAATFITPELKFLRLCSTDNNILIGPRGSGKTTLLKMLTLPALLNWNSGDAEKYSRHIVFNAAYIPADVSWKSQLDHLDLIGLGAKRAEAAFVTHVLRRLILAMSDATDANQKCPEYLQHLKVNADFECEVAFVKYVRTQLGIETPVPTILGLHLGLGRVLESVFEGKEISGFSIEDLPNKLTLIIEAFELYFNARDRRWALLFDEMELAPVGIKKFVFDRLRGFSQNIVFKIAIAPFVEEFQPDNEITSAQAAHDYEIVRLSYPYKDDAYAFTKALFQSTMQRLGTNFKSVEQAIKRPSLQSTHGIKGDRHNRQAQQIPKEFELLSAKDDSFSDYASRFGLFRIKSQKVSESKFAQEVRKVTPIVRAREYYLKANKSGRVVRNRSRKSPELYAGLPSLFEMAEGNPRAILTLTSSISQFAAQERANNPDWNPSVPVTIQYQAMRNVELLLTALLKVTPWVASPSGSPTGLMGLIDEVGRAFERRLLGPKFASEYVGQFLVDREVSKEVERALGLAMNAGALIHCPFDYGLNNELLGRTAGQQFRLSYALAPRYRILLQQGNSINLSTLLKEARALVGQGNLFDADELSESEDD